MAGAPFLGAFCILSTARDAKSRNNRRGRKLDTSEELRLAGLKATTPRLSVLELFKSRVIKHGTAAEVYHKMRNENASFGLATVYRVLMQLAQAGILVRNSFNADAGNGIMKTVSTPWV
jgi:glycerol-3-phosphate dehydrogenase